MVVEVVGSFILIVSNFFGTFELIAGSTITLQTSSDKSISVSDLGYVLSNNRIIYDAKGSGDVVMSLSQTVPLTYPKFSIYWGGNFDSLSLFYAFKTSEVDYAVQNYYISVLDYNKYKMFWTRWSTFTMECGTGNIDENVIRMSWNDVCPIVVNSLHVKSYQDRVVDWKIYDESGLPTNEEQKFTSSHYIGKESNCKQLQVAEEISALSIIVCAVLCEQSVDCFVFSYDNSALICLLYYHKVLPNYATVKYFGK